jgi:hypothetical protein
MHNQDVVSERLFAKKQKKKTKKQILNKFGVGRSALIDV